MPLTVSLNLCQSVCGALLAADAPEAFVVALLTACSAAPCSGNFKGVSSDRASR